MVWIDEVTGYSEKAGECRVRLKTDGFYMAPGGRLRPTSCLEFIAQAYGFISVCHHIFILNPDSKPLSKAFLASVKDARIPGGDILQQLHPGDLLTIKISGVRQMGPIVMFSGEVLKDAQLRETDAAVLAEYAGAA